MSIHLEETQFNVVAENTLLEGKITFSDVTRVHGKITGEVRALPGSTLILCETSLIEGSIQADTLMIDGFVQGDVTATTSVRVSRTGRVIGNIKTPRVQMEFGAYFEGRCSTPNSSDSPPLEVV